MDVLQGRRGRPDDDELVAEEPLGHLVLHDVGERDGLQGLVPAVEVDPRAVLVGELAGVHAPPLRHLDARHRQRLQIVDLVRDAADHAAGVRREDPVAGLGVDLLQRRPAGAEEVRLARVGLGEREHDLAVRVGDRVDEVEVVLVADPRQRAACARAGELQDARRPARRELDEAGRAALGELHVVGDDLRPVGADAIDDLGVHRARERPLQSQLLEGLVIDGHDDEVVGWLLFPPHAEALVDRVELEALEGVGRVGEQAERRRDDEDEREEDRPPVSHRAARPPDSQ